MKGPTDLAARVRDHISRAVDFRIAAQAAELRREPLGAFLLAESWCGYPAQFQMPLIDPLLLSSEPLEALLHSWRARKFRDGFHARQCSLRILNEVQRARHYIRV